jgi:Zn-dependent protease with chaperone function
MSSAAHASAGPSLAGRFAAAIALTIGFYVLALVLGVGLLAFAVVPWFVPGPQNIFVSFGSLVLGGSILVAIVPRRSPFVAPGLRITRDQQPRLFELIEQEARAGGEEVPDDVYLTLEDNAGVAQVSRRRRVLVLGLPLLHILTERQLRGVLAHEFGHYSGGDTRLGPWIYRTRETIGRTVAALMADEGEDDWWAAKITRQPFIYYGRAFLRITAAISRRQEFAADRCAATSVGRDAFVAGLERSHAYGPGFDAYWSGEVVPVLELGRRPPISAGFQRFIAHERVEEAAGRHLAAIREVETDAYDSHPSLAERVAAIASLPAGEPDASPCAFDALRDADRVEADLLKDLGLSLRGFEPVEWDAVGHDVYGARAREFAHRFSSLSEGITFATLADAIFNIGELADKVTDPEVEDRYGFTAAVLGDAALVALEDAGWTITAEPAEPLGAVRGDAFLAPHLAIEAMRANALDAETWHAQVSELGIADLELGTARTVA